ncbi:hypothetical protein APASM_2573 [Actinosynnema pretiosum subsp. pretiosum]|nr:hypothetical protein APASM_2573 [Actinosynnema pretiosum subsp. pretiosum]
MWATPAAGPRSGAALRFGASSWDWRGGWRKSSTPNLRPGSVKSLVNVILRYETGAAFGVRGRAGRRDLGVCRPDRRGVL